MHGITRPLVYVVAGWTGFYVMSVELLSGRILAPDFGNSIYIWGATITVFMLALSLGYLGGGYLSLVNPSLRRLGAVLIVIAAATVPVILVSEPTLGWIFDNVPDPRYGSLLASMALFFVPTVIAGTVAPYSIRLLATHTRVSGQSAGMLYFVSTFGSAAGTLATSFYLVLWFELNSIFIGLIAVTAVLGLAAILAPQEALDAN